MGWRVTSKGTGDFDNPDLWDIKLEPETLEIDIDKLRAELAEAKALNQRLMTALKTLGKICFYRTTGKCCLSCPGQIVCATDGLEKFKDFSPAR